MFCHFRDSGPLLRTLKKGWAKGARLAFLESHIQAYKEAGLHSKRRRTSYTDQVVNEWFTRFHWTLPIESDDPSPSTPSTTIAEDLSPADAKLKGAVISHVGKVCVLDCASQYIVNLAHRPSQVGCIIVIKKPDAYRATNHLKTSTIPSVFLFQGYQGRPSRSRSLKQAGKRGGKRISNRSSALLTISSNRRASPTKVAPPPSTNSRKKNSLSLVRRSRRSGPRGLSLTTSTRRPN